MIFDCEVHAGGNSTIYQTVHWFDQLMNKHSYIAINPWSRDRLIRTKIMQ